MSQKNNVNPDYYKLAGRDKPGEDIIRGNRKEDTDQDNEPENFIPGPGPGKGKPGMMAKEKSSEQNRSSKK
ncbi:MAG TPA: hypothetical protein VFC63_24840 [Blastocatellia bacterium]|nr:hypothetical protein [Blastocatellia bacterium]